MNNKNYRSVFRAILFVLLILQVTVYAQAPGYIGKRTQVYYGINIGPAFKGATYSDRYWNGQHEFSIQHAFTEHWQTGFSIKLFKTLYDNKRYINSENTHPSNNYKIAGAGLMWTFRYFKPKYVAPWGKYFEFGVVVNYVRASYDSYMNVLKQVKNHDTLYSNFGPNVQSFITPDILFGWGKTRIIKDKFIVDYGWNACLLALGGVITDYVHSQNTNYTYDNYIAETYRERLHGINRFNIYLRLGYLF